MKKYSLFSVLVVVFFLSFAGMVQADLAENTVLIINVEGIRYNDDALELKTTVENAGAIVTFKNLNTSTDTEIAQLVSSSSFDQIWFIDWCREYPDAYSTTYQAIANWYNFKPSVEIICDGRMISSYYQDDRWQTEGQMLSENYYTNLKIRGGGLVLATDDSDYVDGINTLNNLIGLNVFTGNFSLYQIPVDSTHPLMCSPNLFTELRDDSSPSQTPYGLQPNGRILYSVAWHSGSHNTPGISTTIENIDTTIGFHVDIDSPSNNSFFSHGESITFIASSSETTPPYNYTWSSDIDGNLGVGQTLTVSNLSNNSHVITLTGTDGASGADTAQINLIPTCYTESDLNAAREEARQACIDNPTSCGIEVGGGYDEGYEAGRQDGYEAGKATCGNNDCNTATDGGCAILNDNLDISMPCIDVFGSQLPLYLEKSICKDDPFGYYWQLNLE